MYIRIPVRFRFALRSSYVKMISVWIFGLVLGILFAAGAEPSFLSLMRRFLSYPVSIVILLILAVLPFLISAYAVLMKRQEIVLTVLFCKAFLFAFFGLSAHLIYGSAGWLLQPMVQFPDLLLMPMLIWFCLRTERTLLKDHVTCLCTAVIAVLIHSFVVLPFLAQLID